MKKGKRSHGEGSVWKLKSGVWRGQLMDGYSDDGKKRIINFSGETRGEVLDKIREYRKQIDANVHIDKSLSLSSWADIWYADHKTQVQASTYSGYYYTLQIIKREMGERILCEILPIDVNRMMDSLVEDGYGLSQIRKCRTMLIQIFDSAERNNLTMGNPARKAKIIKDRDGTLSKPRYKKDSFSDAEVSILREELPNNLVGHSIRLLLDTGMRVQELVALSREDIAPDGSSVVINKAIKTVSNIPDLGGPKSKSAYRTIPVPDTARSSAQYLREHGGASLIWSLPGRKPYYSVGAFRRRYYTALRKINSVRLLPPHCCRHTYITRLQKCGVPIELIAKLAGHADISTTDTYAHTALETLAQAVSVLT